MSKRTETKPIPIMDAQSAVGDKYADHPLFADLEEASAAQYRARIAEAYRVQGRLSLERPIPASQATIDYLVGEALAGRSRKASQAALVEMLHGFDEGSATRESRL